MNLVDFVRSAQAGTVRLLNKAGEAIGLRSFEDLDKPIVEVQGWVKILMRQNGKIVPGSLREDHNIWTNTGREYLAMLMSLSAPGMRFRSDSVAYIGVGTGTQLEEAGVLNLVSPVEYASGLFLASLDVPPSFPLTPARTTVRYHRKFAENEITLSPGSRVNISELGLFTNGSPTALVPYAPGTRDLTIGQSAQQAPVAYKSFEPLGKTDALELEVSWEIRF